MKSSVETLSQTRVKLTVEVPYEELKPSVDAAYKAISSQISIPGFRPGRPTAEYLGYVITRLLAVGSLYLALIAVLGAGTLGILAATSPQDSPPPTRAPAASLAGA